MLRPRTEAAIRAARAAGTEVIVVTGRMFRAVRPYLDQAGLDGPVVGYQGAAVVDPRSGEFLLHEPIPLPLAREAITAVEETGHTLNVYVRDELCVDAVTAEARAYAEFQDLPINPVGNLLAWLEEPPTKLVSVGDSHELDVLEARLRARFGERMHISKSLPQFLELSAPGVTKGSGLEWLARRRGFARGRIVGFGDGENDVELLEWSGYAVAVANAHERVRAVADWICPGPDEEGVGRVLEAWLERRRG